MNDQEAKEKQKEFDVYVKEHFGEGSSYVSYIMDKDGNVVLFSNRQPSISGLMLLEAVQYIGKVCQKQNEERNAKLN